MKKLNAILVAITLIIVIATTLTACQTPNTDVKAKTEAKEKTSKKDTVKKPENKGEVGDTKYEVTEDGDYIVTDKKGDSKKLSEDEFLNWYYSMAGEDTSSQGKSSGQSSKPSSGQSSSGGQQSTSGQGQGGGNKDKPVNPQPQTETPTEKPTQPPTQPQTEPETQWTPECPAYQNGYKHFWVPVQEYFQPVYEDRTRCNHCGTVMTHQEFAQHDCIDDNQVTGGLIGNVISITVGEKSIGVYAEGKAPEFSRKGSVLYYECFYCGKRQ